MTGRAGQPLEVNGRNPFVQSATGAPSRPPSGTTAVLITEMAAFAARLGRHLVGVDLAFIAANRIVLQPFAVAIDAGQPGGQVHILIPLPLLVAALIHVDIRMAEVAAIRTGSCR